MKKSLVLAMAMAMGVTASAYAANPFSDVPAGHWAYDSISQLEKAGVIDGYGSVFGGEKLMTRYEMAQIVAKAMAKGANCDKLAAEFADELDALGVRVAKLEKKVDNVKITGNIRYSYKGANKGDGNHNGAKSASYNRFRTRLFVNGGINNNWKYTGMLENDRYMVSGNAKADDIILKRAWVDGRIGGVKVSGGRKYFNVATMIDSEADGLEAKYSFKGINVTGWAMKNLKTDKVGYGTATEDSDRVYMAKIDTKFERMGTAISYWKVDSKEPKGLGVGEIWTLALDYPVVKDLKLAGEYFHGDNAKDKDNDKNGYSISLNYRGAKAAKPGTWGLWANYQDRPLYTMISPSILVYAAHNPDLKLPADGFKGWEFGGNYTFAKNIVGGLRYYDLQDREGDKKHARTVWGEVIFTF
ncbi:MAG: S-layer homology domain-containing protein [Phascolarctobacterium sp.]|nr:S-layer homology domain-containing protein [Candidatus Phascolarctobacterium caballi]